jgi:hypothetical protein
MKNKFFQVSLLAALLSGVAAAQSNDRVIRLQAVTVTEPRYSEAEKQIESNLNELREFAQAPGSIKVDLPLLKRNATAEARAKLPDMAAVKPLMLRAAIKA